LSRRLNGGIQGNPLKRLDVQRGTRSFIRVERRPRPVWVRKHAETFGRKQLPGERGKGSKRSPRESTSCGKEKAPPPIIRVAEYFADFRILPGYGIEEEDGGGLFTKKKFLLKDAQKGG